MKTLPVAMSIAGSDSSGGAGFQADLKTFAALGVFGTSAITAVTAQNTQGVQGAFALTGEEVAAQITSVLSDMPMAAFKIGMLPSADVANAVCDVLERYRRIPLVLDPVLVSTSGARLASAAVVTVLKERLAPRSTLITPNLPETFTLTGIRVTDLQSQRQAAKRLYNEGGCAALIKGGHGRGEVLVDVLASKEGVFQFENKRLDTVHTHGTGCTLSSAIAAFLARAFSLQDSIQKAHDYVHGAILNAPHLGKGHGPLHHLYPFYSRAGLDAVHTKSKSNVDVEANQDAVDQRLMLAAVEMAKLSELQGDVPVGALITHQGRIVGRGYNTRERDQSALGHAEVNAIKEASEALGTWRLSECTLYVTLEPCHMCAGAIQSARLARVVYGASDVKTGAVRSLARVCDDLRLNHRLVVKEGVHEEICSEQLRSFFAKLRGDS